MALRRSRTLVKNCARFFQFFRFFLHSGARTSEIKEMRPSEERLEELDRETEGLKEKEMDSR